MTAPATPPSQFTTPPPDGKVSVSLPTGGGPGSVTLRVPPVPVPRAVIYGKRVFVVDPTTRTTDPWPAFVEVQPIYADYAGDVIAAAGDNVKLVLFEAHRVLSALEVMVPRGLRRDWETLVGKLAVLVGHRPAKVGTPPSSPTSNPSAAP